METSILEIDNLTFQYDKRVKEKTLANVSLRVNRGEWLSIVGHNGSGKSTLARLLVGLLEPEEGSISINGIELNEETKWEIRKQIGLVFQNPDNQFIGTTVQDDVAFGLENIHMPYEEMKKRVDQAIEMVGMEEFRLHDPSRLSGGQKQRVAIAGILAFNPSILLLDEAFVMLDPISRRQLLTTLHHLQKSHNLTIISITHDMNEAAEADRVIVMRSGEIVRDGRPESVFDKESGLQAPFSEQLRRTLMKKGSNVPVGYMSEEEMVQWLCK